MRLYWYLQSKELRKNQTLGLGTNEMHPIDTTKHSTTNLRRKDIEQFRHNQTRDHFTKAYDWRPSGRSCDP